jgi:hypothetical protein
MTRVGFLRKLMELAALFALGVLTIIGSFDYAHGAPAKDQQPTEKFQRPVVPLKLSAFADGISNCSRPTPSSTGFWKLSAKEVASLDKVLLRHFRTTGVAKRLPYPLAEYARQYLGLQRDGKRVVYINALRIKRKSLIVETVSDEFLRLCDGGGEAWGIEYDTERKAFGELETNAD